MREKNQFQVTVTTPAFGDSTFHDTPAEDKWRNLDVACATLAGTGSFFSRNIVPFLQHMDLFKDDAEKYFNIDGNIARSLVKTGLVRLFWLF